MTAKAPRSGRTVAAVTGAAVGALLAAAFIDWGVTEGVALAFAVLLLGNLLVPRTLWWAHLVPFMGFVARIAGPSLAGVLLFVASRYTTAVGRLGPAEVVVVTATNAWVVSVVQRIAARIRGQTGVTRIAVVGSARLAGCLQRELQLANASQYEIVGRVAVPDRRQQGEVPALGSLRELGQIVERHRINLLIMMSDVPRLAVFDEFARSCLHLPVHLEEMSLFYERTFGHVAVADVNSAWFRYLMESGSRVEQTRATRALDVALASLIAILTAPLMAVLVLLIKRDGGPVLFRQLRIGERGKPFTILKFRTMHVGVSSAWAEVEDARVTTIGRILRRAHLDELPQLVNILRGEMSLVGPRPEQPGFVEHLEEIVPYYARRQLIRPGLTGWAQVRCGYSGSDIGSAWKVAHDLFYLKHRSFGLNLLILGETLRMLVADPQYSAEPASVDFILAPARAVPNGAGPEQPAVSGSPIETSAARAHSDQRRGGLISAGGAGDRVRPDDRLSRETGS
jgi:lipopolysaccharide/colanic/teichoic acid biosynthesis glycosyltransferase